jgi:hypothetical protein
LEDDMPGLTRALRALTLSLLAGGTLALSAEPAEAQGRGRKSGHDKQKHVERDVRRSERRLRLDDRVAVRRDDRDRYDDRRIGRDRDDDRYARRRRPVVVDRSRGYSRVPPGHLPPPGLCRIWIDGVPPGRQPRPTDCATAQRYRPVNARMIYGGARDRGDDRYNERYDDRDRYPDRSRDRSPDRNPDRNPDRYPEGRTQPRIRLPWP